MIQHSDFLTGLFVDRSTDETDALKVKRLLNCMLREGTEQKPDAFTRSSVSCQVFGKQAADPETRG